MRQNSQQSNENAPTGPEAAPSILEQYRPDVVVRSVIPVTVRIDNVKPKQVWEWRTYY